MDAVRDKNQINSGVGNHKNKPWAERTRILLGFALAVFTLTYGFWTIQHSFPGTFHTRAFERFYKNYGSYARLAFLFTFAYYALSVILKKNILQDIGKPLIVKLLKITRQWHIPAAILAISFVVVHVVSVFLYGFKWDFNNVTGVLALLALLPVPMSGILRQRKLDRKWHWASGISFAVLFAIHSFL